MISDGSAVKVGFSSNPESRLEALQAGHSARLVLIGTLKSTMAREKAFHKKNRQFAVLGEWYSTAMLDAIKTQLGIQL